MDALAGTTGLLERNAAHGGFGFFLDVGLAFGIAAPPGKSETLFHCLLEFFVIGGVVGIRFAERQSAIEERRLNFRECWMTAAAIPCCGNERLTFFAGPIATGQHDRPLATSLGPSSRRSGTPRISQSLNLKPGLEPSRSSNFTRMPASTSSLRSFARDSRTLDFSSSVLKIGTITNWKGARRGGKINPWSSPCTMMIAPTKRVESPQEVVQQCCSTPPLSR